MSYHGRTMRGKGYRVVMLAVARGGAVGGGGGERERGQLAVSCKAGGGGKRLPCGHLQVADKSQTELTTLPLTANCFHRLWLLLPGTDCTDPQAALAWRGVAQQGSSTSVL